MVAFIKLAHLKIHRGLAFQIEADLASLSHVSNYYFALLFSPLASHRWLYTALPGNPCPAARTSAESDRDCSGSQRTVLLSVAYYYGWHCTASYQICNKRIAFNFRVPWLQCELVLIWHKLLCFVLFLSAKIMNTKINAICIKEHSVFLLQTLGNSISWGHRFQHQLAVSKISLV